MNLKTSYKIVILILTLIMTIIMIWQCSDTKEGEGINFNTQNAEKGTVNNVLGNQYNINSDENKVTETRGYKIIGSVNLLKHLQNNSEIIIDQNSNFTIELKYSGSLNIVSKEYNTYNYSGGNLVVYVNKTPCSNLSFLKINALKANDKNKINEAIYSEIEALVQHNMEKITSRILECL